MVALSQKGDISPGFPACFDSRLWRSRTVTTHRFCSSLRRTDSGSGFLGREQGSSAALCGWHLPASRSLVDPRGGADLAASTPTPGEIITSSLLTSRISFNYAFRTSRLVFAVAQPPAAVLSSDCYQLAHCVVGWRSRSSRPSAPFATATVVRALSPPACALRPVVQSTHPAVELRARGWNT